MQEWTVVTRSPDETAGLAERLGQLVAAGDVITLAGDLGAGKTSFTKGLAKGLGVKGVVNSPTFTIIKEYQGRLPLYHMDVYRMEDEAEELGLEEYFYGEGVSVVEWPTRIEEQLPENHLSIAIYHLDETSRKLTVTASGKREQQLGKEWLE